MAHLQDSTVVELVTESWWLANKKVTALFNKLTEVDMKRSIAPGKNTGQYIAGHLVAMNDMTLSLISSSHLVYSDMQHAFVAGDRTAEPGLSFDELKERWTQLNVNFTNCFVNMDEDKWFEGLHKTHENDKANRLHVLLSSAQHQSYHAGQLTLLL